MSQKNKTKHNILSPPSTENKYMLSCNNIKISIALLIITFNLVNSLVNLVDFNQKKKKVPGVSAIYLLN